MAGLVPTGSSVTNVLKNSPLPKEIDHEKNIVLAVCFIIVMPVFGQTAEEYNDMGVLFSNMGFFTHSA
jgi:hypothetical protein